LGYGSSNLFAPMVQPRKVFGVATQITIVNTMYYV
jgi:hypothetical protein